MKELVRFSCFGLLLWGCGGRATPAEAPVAEAEAPSVEAPEPAKADTPSDDAKPEPKPNKPAAAEPIFTDGMSVAEAEKAIPQGAERANIDQETMSKPLQDTAVYEPCKPGAARLQLKIAVWDGKAVGIDATSTPKNDKLVSCIKDRIKGLTWQAHVKSLNTVDYSF
ncbi:MAG TPA: hypothetical protein VEQ58_15855 [Polyangiaceae bacterium]|nr:hypothetical protein [Polyangiaceae bacterium]